jgi:hypothetical protein
MSKAVASKTTRESHGPRETSTKDITDEATDARAGSETNERALTFNLWIERSVAVAISEVVGRAIDGKTTDARLRIGR